MEAKHVCVCGKPATHIVLATGSTVCNLHKPDGFVCRPVTLLYRKAPPIK
jgi:hypothetical protein